MIATLVAAILIALPLTGIAWWALQDSNDNNDWLVRAIRTVNAVVLSKAGFQILLGVLAALSAGYLWVHARRRRQEADQSGFRRRH